MSGTPRSRPTLAPLLNVREGARAVAFYKAAFGAEEIFVLSEGGVVAHLSIGAADFWLADESLEHQNPSPDSLGGSTTRIVLTVDDPDAVFQRAVAAGARILYPVEDQSYGWRVGRLVDPFGHHWEIGKPLP
ncbi:MAG TPA: VOC family protein [Acidobacteriaceae bacterium]|jgi:PhnB protein|nr:VOC family protein [Acidobacteriaceae bacterium]